MPVADVHDMGPRSEEEQGFRTILAHSLSICKERFETPQKFGHFGEEFLEIHSSDLSYNLTNFSTDHPQAPCQVRRGCRKVHSSYKLRPSGAEKTPKKSPKNRGRGPACGGLKRGSGPWTGIVRHRNRPPASFVGGDIWVLSFSFPPKFPQNGGTEGAESGITRKYTSRATNVQNFTALRRR